MFYGASSFDQSLNWNTENVTNMAHMFHKTIHFNHSLNWNTENVTNMAHMFYGASSFNQPLNWNTKNVIDMSAMFYEAITFSQNNIVWNMSNVQYHNDMFTNTPIQEKYNITTLKDLPETHAFFNWARRKNFMMTFNEMLKGKHDHNVFNNKDIYMHIVSFI